MWKGSTPASEGRLSTPPRSMDTAKEKLTLGTACILLAAIYLDESKSSWRKDGGQGNRGFGAVVIRIVMAMCGEISQRNKSECKEPSSRDEAKVQAKGDFSVAGLKIEARRAPKPKGGNGRVKHSRSNACCAVCAGGLAAGLAVSSLQCVCVSGAGKMGRPAAAEIRASRRLRNSDCHAATVMPCTTMGEAASLLAWKGGAGDLVPGHGSFKLLMPTEGKQRERKST